MNKIIIKSAMSTKRGDDGAGFGHANTTTVELTLPQQYEDTK